MSDRETKVIKVGELDVVVKTYATAREANAIQQTYFKGAKMEVVGDSPKISEFNPGMQFEVEKEMIAQMVVSIGDKSENLVEVALDLKSEDYNELVAQLDSLVAKKKS